VLKAHLAQLAQLEQVVHKVRWEIQDQMELQELLAHFDPLVAGVLAPGALVAALVALPYVDRNPSRAPRDRKVALLLFWAIFVGLVVLTIIGAFFRGSGWGFVLPWEHLYFEP
jgi:quinol-cytochrome oxidoreductase complex cytochrome b subunit